MNAKLKPIACLLLIRGTSEIFPRLARTRAVVLTHLTDKAGWFPRKQKTNFKPCADSHKGGSLRLRIVLGVS